MRRLTLVLLAISTLILVPLAKKIVAVSRLKGTRNDNKADLWERMRSAELEPTARLRSELERMRRAELERPRASEPSPPRGAAPPAATARGAFPVVPPATARGAFPVVPPATARGAFPVVPRRGEPAAAPLPRRGEQTTVPRRGERTPVRPADCGYLGWDHYEARLADTRTVCEGFTTIRCPTMDTVVGPKMRKAWFCTFENLVFDGAKWRAFCDVTRWGRDRRYLEDLPWAFGRDVLVSSGAPPASTPKKARPTYVAFGDCRTGNPGHCIGDWQNYRIVSRVLNETSFDAILFAGFGDGRWRGEWDAVVEPEAAVYATGALSPLGMHGPHWQVGHYLGAARARPGCRGRPPPSPVLVDITTRATAAAAVDFCGLVRAKRVRAAGAPCGASAFVFLYVLRPARRTGGDAAPLREISNVDALLAAVEDEHPTAAVVAADFMRLSPVEQEAAVRRADVVFGTHGGGLWNAVRWMRPPQALLEIMPAGGPGSTENIAHGLGVAYYEVRCDACTRATGFSGDVSIVRCLEQLGRAVAAVPAVPAAAAAAVAAPVVSPPRPPPAAPRPPVWQAIGFN